MQDIKPIGSLVNADRITNDQKGLPVAASQIGQILAKAREALGMEQDEAARSIGIHAQTLSKYERGAIKKVPVDVVVGLAKIYGLRIEDVLSQNGESLSHSVPRGTGAVAESRTDYSVIDDDSWSPNPALTRKIPKRAYDVAIAYCTRLQTNKWPREEIEQIERLMIDPRYAQANKRKGLELSEDDHIMLVDATWEAVKATAAALGRQV